MGINYNIVWDVAKNIIPVIKEQIEAVVKETDAGTKD